MTTHVARSGLAVLESVGERRTPDGSSRVEEQLRRVVDLALEGVWTLDASFVTEFANTRMAAMLGYTPEEMVGVPAIDFSDPAERARSELQLAERRRGVRASSEIKLRRKDGTWVPVKMESTALFDAAGNFDGAVAMVTDLTERNRADRALKEAEAQLRHAQKMEAVGRLAGGIAHDFNNLLSAVLAYGEVALEELGPDHPVAPDIGEMRKAAERAAVLTQQLLSFSRRQPLEPRSLDPNALVTGVGKLVRRLLGEDIELTITEGEIDGCVRADRGSLEQVLMNLAVNARDAMPTGGRLAIRTERVTLDEAFARTHVGVVPGSHVALTVSDTGIGMDAETRARAFEPFFTTKPAGRGTGLGLSTVFSIVQQSGGTIWIESAPGAGTTFTIYLPLVDVAAPSLTSRPDGATPRGTETILLVEDDERVLLVAAEVLRRSGYDVLEAHSAGQAVLLCESHPRPIDLLLTDVVMPQLSGPALAQRVAALRPAMTVLFMSGYADDSTLRHGAIGSGVAYLAKPFTRDSLTTKVREVLDAR